MRVATSLLLGGALAIGCGAPMPRPPEPPPRSERCTPGGDGSYTEAPFAKLSDYCLLALEGGAITPLAGLVYELNTPLYSDGATKLRTVWIPGDQHAVFDAEGPMIFPEGTILTKSFGFAADRRRPTEAVTWIETRVLIRTATTWHAFTYVWNAEQTDAKISYAGGARHLAFIDTDGAMKSSNYLVPNKNQCAQCHRSGEMLALGPTARNLNRTRAYPEGRENQLLHWARIGILSGAPSDPRTVPALPAYDDATTGSTTARARAYLEVNCSHCHNPLGSARTTGLYLGGAELDPLRLGLCKSPVAAGEATGGFSYDVVPGDPDRSIMIFRMRATSPGAAMPLIGRSLVHQAGVALIADWIAGLAGSCN
jgi:uncharacterized repeat protein (TIGR03806 family)